MALKEIRLRRRGDCGIQGINDRRKELVADCSLSLGFDILVKDLRSVDAVLASRRV
jgi:hypothetical protein